MHLYIGTKGHVCALDVKSGSEVWRTDLGHRLVGMDVSLLVADGRVFAGAGGYIAALDAQTGAILWTNDLKGLGFNRVALAMLGQSVQYLTPESQPAVIPVVLK
ncbi:MAG TPA: PQQ-binding-like beta-propeller repeat protein [Planctomycetota bacterium]|nr:PQQ-binding-like beta-propeller repeat protein [Planctomycetota bacterium]